MTDRLSKFEWERKIQDYYESLGRPIPSEEKEFWWFRNQGLRLERPGLIRFQYAGVEFQKFECEVGYWTGAITIGLSRAPFPFYLEPASKYSKDFEFYMADEEYAMLFMLMDHDLPRLAKGFYETV